MKTCCVCNEIKSIDFFHRGKSPDGLAYACKSCKKTQDAQSHARNREKRLVKRRVDSRERQEWLRQLKAGPCTDCGVQYEWYVYHWDHLPGTNKIFEIGDGHHRSKATILSEISKCELVCANCHAIRTYSRQYSATGNTSVS